MISTDQVVNYDYDLWRSATVYFEISVCNTSFKIGPKTAKTSQHAQDAAPDMRWYAVHCSIHGGADDEANGRSKLWIFSAWIEKMRAWWRLRNIRYVLRYGTLHLLDMAYLENTVTLQIHSLTPYPFFEELHCVELFAGVKTVAKGFQWGAHWLTNESHWAQLILIIEKGISLVAFKAIGIQSSNLWDQGW